MSLSGCFESPAAQSVSTARDAEGDTSPRVGTPTVETVSHTACTCCGCGWWTHGSSRWCCCGMSLSRLGSNSLCSACCQACVPALNSTVAPATSTCASTRVACTERPTGTGVDISVFRDRVSGCQASVISVPVSSHASLGHGSCPVGSARGGAKSCVSEFRMCLTWMGLGAGFGSLTPGSRRAWQSCCFG